MTGIQQHLINLLKEIDEICTDNNIPYILGGRIAKDAVLTGHFMGDYIDVSVMMRGKDFKKFCKQASKRKNRVVESVLSNPDYIAGMSMRYVDENTTMFYGDTSKKYRSKGIFVTINKCRNIPKNRFLAKIANAIDSLVFLIAKDEMPNGKKRQMVFKTVKICSKLIGKLNFVKLLVAIQNILVSSSGKKLAYVRPLEKNINLSANVFTKVEKIKFESGEFFVPVEKDEYLKKVFSESWKEDDKPVNIENPHLLICSTEVSYKDLDNDNGLYADYEKIMIKSAKRKPLTVKIKKIQKKMQKYWSYLFITEERYRLYDLYMPKLDILQEKFENNKIEELKADMEEYLSVLREYLSKDMPLVICPELDNLAIKILEKTGEETLAIKFKETCKKVPFKSVSITN